MLYISINRKNCSLSGDNSLDGIGCQEDNLRMRTTKSGVKMKKRKDYVDELISRMPEHRVKRARKEAEKEILKKSRS